MRRLERNPAMLPVLALAVLALAQGRPQLGAPAPRLLTHSVDAYACFAPDGRSLVYQSNPGGNFDLYTIALDGSEPRLLVSSPADDITPQWSRDGKSLIFVSERDGNREIYVSDAQGGNLRNLSRNPAADIHPCWSRDGSRVLFSSNREKLHDDDFDVYEMRADGSGVTRLTQGPEVDTYASWSADEKRIVTRRKIGKDNEVYVLNADGSGPVDISNDPAAYDGWPVWSPDGARIAYAGGGPDEGDRFIFLVDPDGKNRVQLTKRGPGNARCYDTQPCLSPDGTRLVFTRYEPSEDYERARLCLLTIPPRKA